MAASKSAASKTTPKAATRAKTAVQPTTSAAPARRRRRASVAAGAARASGERARHRTTPLLADAPEPPHLRVVGPDESAPQAAAPDLGAIVDAAQGVATTLASALGIPREDAERKVAEGLAFLRRRLTGDFTVDAYGFDSDFTDHVLMPLLRPLFYKWFRTEVRGVENIPADGGVLLVANHSGTIAVDSLMVGVAIRDQHPQHRALRELGADMVFSTPGLATIARMGGSTLATNVDAERLLADGELVGVFPEGFKGVGKPFSERYKLQRFGRGGFVSAAIRTGVPIVPCSIVGAEEIYPMLANLKPLARLTGLPYFPVTPLFPHFGLLGAIPLPSKWIIEFGAPVETAHLGAGAADDPMIVFDLTDRIREGIQQSLYGLLTQRRSAFF